VRTLVAAGVDRSALTAPLRRCLRGVEVRAEVAELRCRIAELP
jgi:hypothetical protein